MSDIFISYASADREKAKMLAGALEQKNWKVWWDRNILHGKKYDDVIQEALDTSKCIVVLWSNESVNSDYVKDEAEEGTKRNILVPVLIEDVKIPLGFRRIQAAKLYDWERFSEHKEFDILVESILVNISESTKEIKENREAVFWQKSKENKNIEFYKSYLRRYPGGKYEKEALEKILKLQKEKNLHEKIFIVIVIIVIIIFVIFNLAK